MVIYSFISFNANQRHISAVGHDEINLDNDNNFDEDDLILFFMSNFWLGVVNLKNAKHSKKDKQKCNAYRVTS